MFAEQARNRSLTGVATSTPWAGAVDHAHRRPGGTTMMHIRGPPPSTRRRLLAMPQRRSPQRFAAQLGGARSPRYSGAHRAAVSNGPQHQARGVVTPVKRAVARLLGDMKASLPQRWPGTVKPADNSEACDSEIEQLDLARVGDADFPGVTSR